MKILKIATLTLIALGLIFSGAFAAKAGLAEKGKALFDDPKAFGGSTSCSSCHPDGKGLETAGSKTSWMTPAGPAKSLEEAINLCIVNANKGKALDVKSAEMKQLVAYIKSLGKGSEKGKEMPKKAPGY